MSSDVAEKKELSGLDKAAIYLLNLPKEDAEKVLQHLSSSQIQQIGEKMSTLNNVESEELNEVMQNFIDTVNVQTEIGIDNETHIKDVFKGVLGEDQANNILNKIFKVKPMKALDSLKWISSKELASIISKEHNQIQATILSYLGPNQAAEVLTYFDASTRFEIINRIANIESLNPKALEHLNNVIEKQLSGTSPSSESEIGGIKTVADIINNADREVSEDLINKLKESSPELCQSVEDLMFIFENLLDVDDRGIQTLLKEISTDQLVVALKGADEEIKDKIFKNMSKRAADLLKDDLESKGPLKLSEVEAAQREILIVAKKLADDGEIVLGGSGKEEMV